MVSTSDITPDKIKSNKKIIKQTNKYFPNFKFLSLFLSVCPLLPLVFPPIHLFLSGGQIEACQGDNHNDYKGNRAHSDRKTRITKSWTMSFKNNPYRNINFKKFQQGSNFSFVVKSFLRVPQQIALWCKKWNQGLWFFFFLFFFFPFCFVISAFMDCNVTRKWGRIGQCKK